MNKWLLILVLFALCTGCSIEKRVHTGGYYIKWHKHYKGSKNEAKVEKETDTTSTVLLEDSVSAIPDEIEVPDPEIDSVSSSDNKQERAKLEPLPRKERKFEPLGVLAFKILCADVLIGIIADNTHGAVQEVRYVVLFLLIMAVSLVLGIISMIRYLRNPRHYRFNIFAIVAILVPLFFFTMLILGDIAVSWKYLLPKYW